MQRRCQGQLGGVAAWASNGDRGDLEACHDVWEEVEEGGVEVEEEGEWERASSRHLGRHGVTAMQMMQMLQLLLML